jgi:glycosyltransferase EpsD
MVAVRRWKWLVELALSDRMITLSKDMCRRWSECLRLDSLPYPLRSHYKSRLNYIYSIVDGERFSPPNELKASDIRNRIGIQGDPLITYVGWFHPKKQQLSFIKKALPSLVNEVPSLKVAFLGDFDPDSNEHAKASLEAVNRMDLGDDVRFVGYRDDVERWYQAADLNVLASEKEGLARSMIESLSCGTPVVSFNVASAKEILEKHDCGRVGPQGDYDQLQEAVVELWLDDSLRKEMGQRGVKVTRELFDPEAIAHQYQKLYEEVSCKE